MTSTLDVDWTLVISESLCPYSDSLIVCFALFDQVENANDVKKHVDSLHLVNDAPVHVFLNPHMISSFRHIQLSVLRALQNSKLHQMKSKTLNTEILFSLSPSAHISECLRLFGIDATSSEILVAAVISDDQTGQEKFDSITKIIHGRQIDPRTKIGAPSFLDGNALVKHMKINYDELHLPGGLEAAIIARVAIKGI